ncbi:MAG: hypothetical protein ACJ702_09220 [Nitrososphaeraceae archaeon]
MVSDYYKSRKKSTKKQNYMVNTGRVKLLDSFYFENQVWGALHKAWKGYVIAKNKDEYDKMERYARIIQESQYDLGLEVSSFDNIGMPASSFLWQIVQKDENKKYQIKSIKLTVNTNKKGSLMIMPIVKILQMIIISQIDLLHRGHYSVLG